MKKDVSQYTVAELRSYARSQGVPGYSKLRKEALLKKIASTHQPVSSYSTSYSTTSYSNLYPTCIKQKKEDILDQAEHLNVSITKPGSTNLRTKNDLCSEIACVKKDQTTVIDQAAALGIFGKSKASLCAKMSVDQPLPSPCAKYSTKDDLIFEVNSMGISPFKPGTKKYLSKEDLCTEIRKAEYAIKKSAAINELPKLTKTKPRSKTKTKPRSERIVEPEMQVAMTEKNSFSEIGRIEIDPSYSFYSNIRGEKGHWDKLFINKGSKPFSFPVGIHGYLLTHVPGHRKKQYDGTSTSTQPVSLIEFTTGGKDWITEDSNWYNNKQLVNQMTIQRIEPEPTDEYDMDEIEYQSSLWKKWKKLGIVVKPVRDLNTGNGISHSYIFIGIDLSEWKRDWINAMETIQISPSVFKLVLRDGTPIGYVIYWLGQCLGFDPRGWHSDAGYYDQYMINVGDKYIFGGDQEYYYWRDFIINNENIPTDHKFKVKSVIDNENSSKSWFW